MEVLLRAKRRAAFSVDDGRPRFNFGLDVAKRLRAEATALKIPLVSSLITWKGHSWWGTAPKTVRIGAGESAEPSVVIPLSATLRASKAAFKRPRNASISSWHGS